MSHTPYRPSNGTEGMIFEEKFCNKCKKVDNCNIFFDAMDYDEDDPRYPKELILEDENDIFSGTCTAYEEIDGKKND